jgi:catechol 2,3-dioxygenase-like lactoylglutathione lyase family enzyme
MEGNMIKSTIGHLQLNINADNIGFYKELFTFLGWSLWHEDEKILGVGSEQGSSLWFVSPAKDVSNDYDGPGMNHLALAVASQDEVDQVVSYMKENKIKALFNTPCHRPEFSGGPDKTYYQIIFESPDRIQLEVVYIGPKAP